MTNTIYIIIIIAMILFLIIATILFFINRKKITIKILESKAEKGGSNTKLALGLMFYSGKQVPIDKEKGYKYIKEAAELGNPQAQYLYSGIILGADEDRKPTQKELLEAAQWIEKSANGGFLTAITTIANMYAEGKILKKDAAKSQHYFLKAAEMGHVESQIIVAGIYHFSINSDKIIGYAWYKVAEHNGNDYAKEMANKLYNELTEEAKEKATIKADEYISRYIKNKVN